MFSGERLRQMQETLILLRMETRKIREELREIKVMMKIMAGETIDEADTADEDNLTIKIE